MNRINILSLFIVLGGASALIASTAQSQVGPPKNFVSLQPTTPGTSQSGHANISGTVIAGQFSGGGANLSNLSASNLASGTVPDARLSANVALLNGVGQVFSTGKTFSASASFTNASVPFLISSTNLVSNLNADLLDGQHGTFYQNAANLTGNLPDARLSSNVALLSSVQTFAALKVFGSSIQIPTGGGVGKFLTSDAVGVGSWSVLPPPSGTAGGDLSGAYPNPLVDGLQNRPVSATAPTTGQFLGWNGTNWAPTNDSLLLPFAGIASAASGYAFSVINTNATGLGIFGASPAAAVTGSSSGSTTSSYGVYGMNTFSGNSGAIGGINSGASGLGLNGNTGVFGSSDTGTGVLGTSTSGLAGDFTGVLRTSLFRLTTGAVANRYLVSDAAGNGTWTPLSLSGLVAGGDLSGTYPNPVVDGLQNRPVASTAPTTGQVLAWNGTTWAPANDGLLLPLSASVVLPSEYAVSVSNTSSTGAGVYGQGVKIGISGKCTFGDDTSIAVQGTNESSFGTGGYFESTGDGIGVHGNSIEGIGVKGVSEGDDPSSCGGYFECQAGGYAGYFMGRSYFSSKVGIGTNAPSDLLEVRGGGGPTSLLFQPGKWYGTDTANKATIDISGTGDLLLWDNVHVNNVFTAGSKLFEIDHPLDPLNKFLRHACIESNELKNLYDGVVTTDGRGYATVTVPDWFTALNEKFRYQITVLEDDDSEDFVMAKVAKKLNNGMFVIRTNKPGVEVSWQVTGVRKDAFAQANPLKVEEQKPASLRGKLIHPEAFEKLQHGN